MNFKQLVFLISLIPILHAPVFADTILLSDGNSIHGKVISLKNGIYTIQSPSLGNIQIEQKQVREIRTQSAASPQRISGVDTEINRVEQKITASPNIQQSILGLSSDPAFQEILNDPELMRAIQAQDFEALSKNPKILRLQNNPRLQSISKQLH